MPEVDYCDLRFPVERNRLFIDPVRNLVSLEQGFALSSCTTGTMMYGPAFPSVET